ncbi:MULTISPECIES: hypothetical protein [unclassified Sphingobacterium]|uniref:hypothetical protein n=1 Tax=unclassified Sphingobacterium TaxID=2609468 RepID=UPI0025CB9CCF|nr:MULTISPECIES: hypothetical protein [unclassified Sphingobacterium]
MKIEQIVTSFETSKLLNKVIPGKKSLFSYFKNESGRLFVGETDLKLDSQFECYCYTFSELLNLLPGTLEVNEETYRVSTNTYEKIVFPEGTDYSFARLELLKADEDPNSIDYVARYAYEDKVIAFSQNQKGQYNNLIRFGTTEIEAMAAMLLALIEEDIYK